MASRVVGMYQGSYISFPVGLLIWSSKPSMFNKVTHPVAYWMIAGCPGLPHFGELTKFPNNLAFRISTLIGMNPQRNAIMNQKVIKQGFRCCLGELISGWNSLCISDKVIGDDQDMLVTSFGLWTQGCGNSCKLIPVVRKWLLVQMVLVDSLRSSTMLNPVFCVFIHPWSVEPVSK